MHSRRALVTGGSLSIGREISLVLAEAGADVAVHYSGAADATFGHPDAAKETVAAIADLGRKVVSIEADFERPDEATRCVEAARTALGGVDVLVICASIQYRVPFEDVTPQQIERQIQINFKASVELLQAALPPMKRAGWGRVLTIGSINQTRPESVLAIYAALKSAQHNLCINLAREYAPFGVTVNNLSPGLVATECNRWRRADPEAWMQIERDSSPMRVPDVRTRWPVPHCSSAPMLAVSLPGRISKRRADAIFETFQSSAMGSEDAPGGRRGSMSATMAAQFVADALMMAIWRRGRPEALLHHADRGSQYMSEQFQRLTADHGIVCSMSRAGNVWDNAAMESFFSSLKTERRHAWVS